MGQILINKLNGDIIPLSSRDPIRGVSSAYQTMSIDGVDIVNIDVVTTSEIKFDIGDYAIIFGRKYDINRLPSVNKTSTRKLVYNIELEGMQYQLARASFELSVKTTDNELQDVQADSFIGDLKMFARIIQANMDRVMPNMWNIGDVPETDKDKLISFSETDNCLTALNKISTEFGVEYKIEVVKEEDKYVFTISFGDVGVEHPFTLEYGRGKGLYQLSRHNVTSSNIVTRLRAFGSTKNITTKYRSNRLCLPNKTKSESFIEAADAIEKYGIWEATKYFEEVYPHRVGVISAKLDDSIVKFIDDEMFDLKEKDDSGNSKYLLNGISAKIQFSSGNLAGYDFEIKDYDHSTKTFEIKPKQDDRGDIFPSEKSLAFQFNVGDKYILKDIAYPELYEKQAEVELEEETIKWLDQNSQPKVQYSLSLSEDFVRDISNNDLSATILNVGDYIHIVDSDIGVDKYIRIKTIKRDIKNPFSYQLTISDTVDVITINRIISDLVEVDKIIKNNDLNDPIRTQNSWRTSREVLDMVFDPEGDYYSDKIKPESVDTIALSVGAKSMQFVLKETIFEPNYKGNKNAVNIIGGTLVHYAIEESIKDWYISDNYVTLTFDDQAYYIYAKCQKNGKAGFIVFSDKQKKVDEDPTYYHFWLGVLNSVNVEMDARAISLMYGFTTINGKYVTTGVIQSADGSSKFDLDNAEFQLGDSLSYKDKVLRIKGAITQDSGGNEGPIIVYRGPYSDAIEYYMGNTVTYNGAVYVAASNPPIGTDPSNSNYWEIYVTKGEDGQDGVPGKDGESAITFKSMYAKNGSSSLPPNLNTTSPNPYGWSEMMPHADLFEYIWQTVAQFKDGEMIVNWSNPIRLSGIAGGVPTGGLLYKSNKDYHGTPFRCDVVKYDSRYYIARSDAGVFRDRVPTDKNYWNDFGASFESLATEVLWAENANIGNFIFSDEVLKSQSQINGVNKLILDGKKGAIYAQEGEFGGDVIFRGNIINCHIPDIDSDAISYRDGILINKNLKIKAVRNKSIYLPEDDSYNGMSVSIITELGLVSVKSSTGEFIYDGGEFDTRPGFEGVATGTTRVSRVSIGQEAVFSRLPSGNGNAWYRITSSDHNNIMTGGVSLTYHHRYGRVVLGYNYQEVQYSLFSRGELSIRHSRLLVNTIIIEDDGISSDINLTITNGVVGDILFIRNDSGRKITIGFGQFVQPRAWAIAVCENVGDWNKASWIVVNNS